MTSPNPVEPPADPPQDPTPDPIAALTAELASVRAEMESLRPKPATTDERLDALSSKFDKLAEQLTAVVTGGSKPAAKPAVKGPTPKPAKRQTDPADPPAPRRRSGWFGATASE